MLKIYNTLSHKIEEFKPMNGNTVTMYSCGPTVYDYQHIGHMRRYVGDDILIRVLKLNGYKINHAMNITDVGHLVSDSDTGEDKMEKGAKKFGKSVWEIAKMFEKQFTDSCAVLGINLPKQLMHATDYIQEQIELIKILEKKGFTYKTVDGIYFDTSRFPDYFKLSRQNPEELKKGSRVDFVEGKKNVADFALWKFSYPGGVSFDEFSKSVILEQSDRILLGMKRSYQGLQPFQDDNKINQRQMEWESPWGIGFPGWHIECSAMAMKALGETLDIHTGGIDHINIHHTNEIAQSEAVTCKQFVKYWVHHNFLEVEGQKMSKSLGNFYTVQDVINKNFDPMALRYLYLQTHYRQEMNFTWDALEGAQTALHRLRGNIEDLQGQTEREKGYRSQTYEPGFFDEVNNDLNTPKALSYLWEMVKSNIPAQDKITTLGEMDLVLGLNLFTNYKPQTTDYKIPQEVLHLAKKREVFRKAKDFASSDELRKKILDLGFTVTDTKEGPKIEKVL